MKLLVYACFLSFAGSILFCNQQGLAQGTLQFNQVILYTATTTTVTPFTVPGNKAWKLESGAGSGSTITLQNAAGSTIATLFPNGSLQPTPPVWFPAGFSGKFNFNASGFVSIIEFNLLP